DLATLKSWDTSGDGSLSADEINAGILKDAKGIMAQYDSSAKGYFDQADIQSVLDAHPDTNGGLTAKGVVTYWDTNSDGHVQLSDIVSGMSGYIAVNQSAPVTASTIYQDALAKAQATLDTFDTARKGFITQADVAAAYRANAQLGNPDDAAGTIATWDQSNDGEVSLSELTSGIELSGLANQFMAQLDPTNHRSPVRQISMPSIPDAARVIAGWDSNQDGQIGQDEIVTGLREQAKSYLARFDTANKGYFTLDDVQAGFAITPPSNAALTPSGVMSQWDANRDSKVDLADILAGIAAGVAVDPTWTTATA
ncbi:MAG: EF-hand domain-containing protein, partial [Hyphomicrobiales bacterium]|nr:EF-hand domain-containing protein [Hyphomicrobiales bacterium]